MESNFAFLHAQWPELLTLAQEAEQTARRKPRTACLYARLTLEQAVHWLYDHDAYLERPYGTTLNDLVEARSFKSNMRRELRAKVKLIQKIGNRAAHEAQPIPLRDSLHAVKELFHVCFWLYRSYDPNAALGRTHTFRDDLIPAGTPQETSRAERTALEQQLAAQRDALAHASAERRAVEDQLLHLREAHDHLAAERQRLREEHDAALALAEDVEAEKLAAEAQAAAQQAALETDLLEALTQIEALQAQLAAAEAVRTAGAAQREARARIPDPHDYDEAATRRVLIDVLLREAGWDPDAPHVAEYKLTGLPTRSGTGYADYVLWDDNGLPLAVVEAKRARQSATAGKTQAKFYADSLEATFGQRPVMFYTNGYEHHLWDDRQYPPRRVQGFYAKTDLQRLVQRRQTRQALAPMPISQAIAGRPYQQEAIRRVTEHFEAGHRRALLVMATGTGKTRTAIALVDLLSRASWIKRVLFLADRKALVKQAADAFKEHAPHLTTLNLLRDKTAGTEKRVIVSTYPTMMNLLEQAETPYTVGHFDLIIIDEAHRSVYQRYRHIFRYFDALLVGLTATPRDEVDRNTYTLFGLHDNIPTFSYELDEAIAQGYLVPYHVFPNETKFLARGITYADLSDADKEEYESKLADPETGEIPGFIEKSALNAWLYNASTVDLVLQQLMERGLKVNDGERIGKTIIFAVNRRHAAFIQERFDANYPQYKGTFAQTITHETPYAEALIEGFKSQEPTPQIAISVDMLDTGIDVREILNLVFFKAVYSKTKFWQMLGRGTRTREDLFGPGLDKVGFYVFDWGGNFAFFQLNPEGKPSSTTEPIGQRLFKLRLRLASALRGSADASEAAVRTALLDLLHQRVATMNLDNFIVRAQRQHVDPFLRRNAWDALSDAEQQVLAQHISALPTADPADVREHPYTKRFDLLVHQAQWAWLQHRQAFASYQARLLDTAERLLTITSIPQVAAEQALLDQIVDGRFWADVQVATLEDLRLRLRPLVAYLTTDPAYTITYTTLEDELAGAVAEDSSGVYRTPANIQQYREEVSAFIQAHAHEGPIAKLRRAQPLTPADLAELEALLFKAEIVESQEAFERAFQRDLESYDLAGLVRRLVGLDEQAIRRAFETFTAAHTLTSTQIRFVHTIVDYIIHNGSITLANLYDQPFTAYSEQGLDGLFRPAQVRQLLHTLDRFRADKANA